MKNLAIEISNYWLMPARYLVNAKRFSRILLSNRKYFFTSRSKSVEVVVSMRTLTSSGIKLKGFHQVYILQLLKTFNELNVSRIRFRNSKFHRLTYKTRSLTKKKSIKKGVLLQLFFYHYHGMK